MTPWSPPGSSVHGILQARILEWVAISFSRGSSQPRDQTQVTTLQKTIYQLSHQGSLGEAFHYEENGKPKAGKRDRVGDTPQSESTQIFIVTQLLSGSAPLPSTASASTEKQFWQFCSPLSHKCPGGESAKAWLVITQRIVTTVYS